MYLSGPKAPRCKGNCLPSGRRCGVLLTTHGFGLPAWRGRFPLEVPFDRAKGTKTRLGRSPLRTSLGYKAGPASSLNSARHPCCGSWYCHHTRLPWTAGPMAGCFPSPGLPWYSGVPAAGGFAAPSCCAAVRAVACPARWFPCIALGDSGGASPSPTPNNARNSAMFRGFLRPAPGSWEQLYTRVRPWQSKNNHTEK